MTPCCVNPSSFRWNAIAGTVIWRNKMTNTKSSNWNDYIPVAKWKMKRKWCSAEMNILKPEAPNGPSVGHQPQIRSRPPVHMDWTDWRGRKLFAVAKSPRFDTCSWCLIATHNAMDILFFLHMSRSFHRLLSITLPRNTLGLVTRRK